MKPYAKTYRKRKDHKAAECGLCSERTDTNKTPTRLAGKTAIKEEYYKNKLLERS